MAERWTEAQKAAITEKGRNIIVSAAAGSGKTSVLSERVCRFVADGGDIERLLVVTFTKAASKEMRSRIRRKIADLCRGETDAACLRECFVHIVEQLMQPRIEIRHRAALFVQRRIALCKYMSECHSVLQLIYKCQMPVHSAGSLSA